MLNCEKCDYFFSYFVGTGATGALLLTWFNFYPGMDK